MSRARSNRAPRIPRGALGASPRGGTALPPGLRNNVLSLRYLLLGFLLSWLPLGLSSHSLSALLIGAFAFAPVLLGFGQFGETLYLLLGFVLGPLLEENLRRAMDGRPLLHLVDRARGY